MLVPSRINENVLTVTAQYRRLRSMLEPVSEYLKEILTQAIAQNDRSIQDKSIKELLSRDVTIEEILNDAFEIPEALIRNNADFVNGCDVCIFPSRYEPFGLTPVEAAANGCIAVTSDLSGLGEELKSMGKGDESDGIYVLPLMNRRDDEITAALKDFLLLLRAMPYEELLALNRKAYQLAVRFSWREKIGNYVAAVEKVM